MIDGELPEIIRGLSVAERVRWILRQPTGRAVAEARIIDLVRDEKARTAEIAAALHVC